MFVLLRRAFPACPPVIWVWKVFSSPPRGLGQFGTDLADQIQCYILRPRWSSFLLKCAEHGHERATTRCSGCVLLKEPLSDLREKKKLTDSRGGVEISPCLFLWWYNYLTRNFPAQARAYGCEEDVRWKTRTSAIKKEHHRSEAHVKISQFKSKFNKSSVAIGSALKPTISKWEMQDAQVQMTFHGFCATTINSTVTQL